MKLIRNIARLIIAPVFIFAGFVKAIDPLGLTYKFSDYFDAFNMEFLGPAALVLAILLSTAELLIGINLLLKLRMKETAWALFVFMVFFAVLTLVIAITNPVTDCGCFGDALILTNWQTFFKNIIFMVPTLIVFAGRNKYIQSFSPLIQWTATAGCYSILLLLSIYSLRTLPLIDFRPYKIGTDIPAGMTIPEGMPLDKYETYLVYEKEGEKREFTLQSPEQPWNDSTWIWVETKNILVEKGYTPPIHDFSLTDLDGMDVTDYFLNDSGYSFLVVMYDITRTDRDQLAELNELMRIADEYNFEVYGMTSSIDSDIFDVMDEVDFSFKLHITDEITLKTMIRSNPGLILVKEGVVLGKWPGSRLPRKTLISDGALSGSLTAVEKKLNKRTALITVLCCAFTAAVATAFRLIYETGKE
jgi:uncharacterized membrane protein YphA (DoxX/SURF4 family)